MVILFAVVIRTERSAKALLSEAERMISCRIGVRELAHDTMLNFQRSTPNTQRSIQSFRVGRWMLSVERWMFCPFSQPSWRNANPVAALCERRPRPPFRLDRLRFQTRRRGPSGHRFVSTFAKFLDHLIIEGRDVIRFAA